MADQTQKQKSKFLSFASFDFKSLHPHKRFNIPGVINQNNKPIHRREISPVTLHYDLGLLKQAIKVLLNFYL